jgi:hypothetical protein
MIADDMSLRLSPRAIHSGMNHVLFKKNITILMLPIALAACAGKNDFTETGGIKTVRSACPAIAIPANTGDITLFQPPESRDANAIDVTATITNLRSNCNSLGGDRITANVTFDVLARRSDASGARTVTLPYFSVVTRAGTQIQSKQLGQIVLQFSDGQLRAQASGGASASISRAEATLPPAVEAKINRKRKAGDLDAAVDPMSDPAIRAAVQQASFELLVGFQLTPEQLAYNATR